MIKLTEKKEDIIYFIKNTEMDEKYTPEEFVKTFVQSSIITEFEKILNRLESYEKIGLEPEEIKVVKADDIGWIDNYAEYMELDKESKLLNTFYSEELEIYFNHI